jgi:hypothetical protein
LSGLKHYRPYRFRLPLRNSTDNSRKAARLGRLVRAAFAAMVLASFCLLRVDAALAESIGVRCTFGPNAVVFEISDTSVVRDGTKSQYARNIAITERYISWESTDCPDCNLVNRFRIDRATGVIEHTWFYQNDVSRQPLSESGTCEKLNSPAGRKIN